MPNVESLEQHNINYVKDDAFEREKKAHQNIIVIILNSYIRKIYHTEML